jgi:hypothetical protein
LLAVYYFDLRYEIRTTVDVIRWDEKVGLQRDAVRPSFLDVLEAQEIKETGNEEDWYRRGTKDGLVIDCDDVPGGTKAIPVIHCESKESLQWSSRFQVFEPQAFHAKRM